MEMSFDAIDVIVSEANAREIVLTHITQAFLLRQGDAVRRAMSQLRNWQATLKGAQKRGEPKLASEINQCCETLHRLIKANTGKYSPKFEGQTAEMAAQPKGRDAILSLLEAERISPEQAMACREIQRIVEIITRGTHAKCQTYQKGSKAGSARGSSSLMPAEVSLFWSRRYLPWHQRLAKKKDNRLKKIAMLVVIDGVSLDRARRICRVSYDRGHKLLVEALDLYIEIREIEESADDHRERATIRTGADCGDNSRPAPHLSAGGRESRALAEDHPV